MEKELVDHPAHYTSTKYEHVVVAESWNLGYHLSSSSKYVLRRDLKDKSATLTDLKKAMWYLDREIALVKGETPRLIVSPKDVSDEWGKRDQHVANYFYQIGQAASLSPQRVVNVYNVSAYLSHLQFAKNSLQHLIDNFS
jgi:hypothetical protein